MGAFNANILPASTGLNLGSPTQLWTAYLQNVFTSTFQSSSLNPALSGVIRLASGDAIAWRNFANTADVSLVTLGAAAGDIPADVLNFNGGGIQGIFISATSTPARSGILRLAATDSVSFRNTADAADLLGLTHNSDDTVTVGDFPGMKQTIILSNTANPAQTGFLRLAQGDTIAWRNAANGGDDSISFDLNDALLVSTQQIDFVASGTHNAALVAQTGGLFTNPRVISRAADNSGDGDLGCSSLFMSGTLSTYRNIATAGSGHAAIYGSTSQKAEIAADASLLSYTPPATVGSYRVRFVLSLSAANSAVLGWTITYKDSNGNAQAPTNLSLFQQGTAAPALTFTTSSAGNYSGQVDIDTDNSATAIVVKLTFTGTSFAGKATATIERAV